MKVKGDELGVEIDFTDSKADQTTQNNNIDLYLTKGYEALAVNMQERSAANVVIEKANADNTPVVFFNTEPEPEALTLSDRIAPYKLATAGMGVCALCLVFFAFTVQAFPTWTIACGLLTTGFGVAMFSSPNMNAIMSCVDRAHYGVASSILATMRTLGQTTGIAITTIVVNARLGHMTLQEAPTDLFESAMHISFWIFFTICVVGMFMSMKRKDT